jgi:hypothetical protein
LRELFNHNAFRPYSIHFLGRVCEGKKYNKKWVAKHQDKVIKVANTKKDCLVAIKNHVRKKV